MQFLAKNTPLFYYPPMFRCIICTAIGLTIFVYIFTYITVLESSFKMLDINHLQESVKPHVSSPKQPCTYEENMMVLQRYNLSDNSTNALKNFVNLTTGDINSSFLHFAAQSVSHLITNYMHPMDRESAETKLYNALTDENITVMTGGYHVSTDTTARLIDGITIIVPYRNRTKNLFVFLGYIHRFLSLRDLNYHIVLAEQVGSKLFNRAKLFNAALTELQLLNESSKRSFSDEHTFDRQFTDCIIFHDVDKLPININAPYTCNGHAVQLLNFGLSFHRHGRQVKPIKKRNGFYEHLYYSDFFGGVTAVTSDILLKVNGFSNVFYGWGGEDDDFRRRLDANAVHIEDTVRCKGRFYLVEHPKDAVFVHRHKHILSRQNVSVRMEEDGLREVHYTFLGRFTHQLYTLYKFEL